MSWVKEKNDFLKEKLPKDVQEKPFYPDAFFYTQYYRDPLKGLHYMAMVIFSLLKIEPNGCMIDFYNEKEVQRGGDAAGFYTKIKDDEGKEREIIVINSKYKDSPLAVGAILAHEMMHLYLYRLGLKLENIQENELMTDLATINTGLSILILNGMSYSSQWLLTVLLIFFGRIYWRSKELAFGYFKPKEYAEHAISYFKEKGLGVEDFIGYVAPMSRHFIPHDLFSRGKNSTLYIKALEKQYIKANFAKGVVAAVIIGGFLIWGQVSTSKQNNLESQIQSCNSALTVSENNINADKERLSSMDNQLTEYENNQDTYDYNNLVYPYNSLVGQVKQEIAEYNTKLADCQKIADEYNAQYPNQN